MRALPHEYRAHCKAHCMAQKGSGRAGSCSPAAVSYGIALPGGGMVCGMRDAV